MKALHQLIKRIEDGEALDRVADLAQRVMSRIVPQESIRKDLLSGTWLGRPLHPVLTDVVIGSWASASALDVLGGKRAEQAADQLVFIGTLAALPTIAAGLSDWAELWGAQQRVGSVHALGNATALSLQIFSIRARRSGKRKKACLLSLTSMVIAAASANLGGYLSFVKGVGVNQTAFEDWPQEWTPVLAEDDLAEDTLTPARADGVRIMLYKKGEQLYALSDRCSHRGCPLHLGQVNDLLLECSCHGSIFRLSDGEVLRGPATVPAPTYEVRCQNGKVEVRLTVR
ncbi:MAG: Rieske 2Fe-2S domain-containing protein [Pseudonocardiales bacterium]|nr:Rieske 2Fe-2S domain-containing protein [Pseudonocardiales bacterium]